MGKAGARLGRWLWAPALLLLLSGAYLWAGYQLVPRLIRSQATAWVKTNLNQSIALGEIRFDPIHFTLDVSDVAIPATGQPMVAAGHLHVGFSILSVFEKAYRFDTVRLDRLFVQAVVRPDRSLNLVDLIPRTRSKGPSPAVRIGTFSVDGGRLVYADRSRAPAASMTLSPIRFTLRDFQTNLADGGAFSLDARGDRGGQYLWTGKLAIAPIASQGHLRVSGLQSATLQQFLSGAMPVALAGGTASFDADYRFAYGAEGMQLNLSVPAIALSGLALTGQSDLFRGRVTLDRLDASIGSLAFAGRPGRIALFQAAMPRLSAQGLTVSPAATGPMRLARIALSDARLDYGARQIAIGGLDLSGAQAGVRRARDGRIDLMALIPKRAAPPSDAARQAQAQPAAPAWTLRLANFTLEDGTLVFEDRAVSPAARFTMASVAVAATGLGSDLTQPVPLHASARIDKRAAFTAEGTVTPATAMADMKIGLTRLPLRPLRPYMPKMADLDLRGGTVSAAGRLHWAGMANMRFRGNAAIDGFNLYETSVNGPLFAWRAFSLKGIDYRPTRVEIARGRLVRPFGRVAVLPNRAFNFVALMQANAPATGNAVAVPIAVTPAKSTAMRFHMKALDIVDGTMGFADYSIDPNFQARVDALRGTVSNISNQPGAIASIDLAGQVIDQYSPVSIKGTMDLLSYVHHTDMHLAFRNIELPIFNPYSGRYAGYAIAKGKLTTELSYQIQDGALKADHHVIVDQLEWGQATDSKDRVPLPVRLATALLKDSRGVIDLDLPVTGSLKDPKFRIGPIIWQIVGNVLEKAVTAPFRLIGSLFAGAEKAQYVDFAPGSASLPPGASQSLAALAKALAEKPELRLDIPAGPGAALDADGLADQRIDAALMAGEKQADVASLGADDLHDRLEDLYRQKLGKRPDFPDFSDDALKAASADAELDADGRRTLLENQWMRGQLRAAFAPAPQALAKLGEARAVAVRDALLAGGTIDPARLFMATQVGPGAEAGHARLELKLN